MGNPNWSSWTKIPGIKTKVGVSAISSGNVVVVAATDESGAVQINSNVLDAGLSAWSPVPGVQTNVTPLLTASSPGLTLYVVGTDEQVYVNSSADGSNWGTTWTVVPGVKTKHAICASPDWYLFSVGLNGHIWMNANPPAGAWTELVIAGNAFRTNASLYSGPSDSAFDGATLYAKGLDNKIWMCNPNGNQDPNPWTKLEGETYVGIAGVPLFTQNNEGFALFMTGRHNEIFFNYNSLGDSAPWTVIDGFKTNAALTAAAVNTLTARGELNLCSVYLFGKGVDEGDIRYAVGQWTD
jgi:hypothetical protein